MEKRSFLTGSPSATQDLGERIGEKLGPGSIVALIGELGSGKTCFAKGLCAGLGIPKRCVTSPTFAFVNEYQGRLPVLHLDLYRIEDVDMALELGVLDLLRQAEPGVAVIEWAERITPLLSYSYLAVNLYFLSARKREIVLSASGEQFRRLLDELEEP